MKNDVLNEIFANVPNIAGKTREESIYRKEIYKTHKNGQEEI